MMSRFKLIFPLLFVIPLSCTVKEDRSVCPCLLDLNCTECIGIAGRLEVAGWDESGEECFREAASGGHCEFEVPRCDFRVAAYCAHDLSGNSRQIVARSGCQADSVYAFAATLDTRRDECRVDVGLRKQFATIRLNFEADGSGIVPDVESLEVHSSSRGFDSRTLEGIYGEYRFSPEIDSQGMYSFRLFRQLDENATVEVSTYSGKSKTFPLGRILGECGYDWAEAGLQDVDLQLDLMRSTVVVVFGNWESGKSIDVSF